jgi:hypothetical protein
MEACGVMRVLFSTTAGTEHFGPLIPFARAAAAAGHTVAVAAPSGFAEMVSGAGFEHQPFGEPSAELIGAVFGRLDQLAFEEADRTVLTEVFGRLDAQAALPHWALMTTGHGLDPADLAPIPETAMWSSGGRRTRSRRGGGSGRARRIRRHDGALAAGVPQVVLPLFSFDQAINAEHVAAANDGIQLTGGLAAVADLPGGAMPRLGRPHFRRRCPRHRSVDCGPSFGPVPASPGTTRQ